MRKWRTPIRSLQVNLLFYRRCTQLPCCIVNVKGQQSSQHKSRPLLKTRWICWFWCEADVYCRLGRWQIHFQPSWRCKGTSREPKTTFPLKFFLIAVWEYSIAFFVKEKRVLTALKRNDCADVAIEVLSLRNNQLGQQALLC